MSKIDNLFLVSNMLVRIINNKWTKAFKELSISPAHAKMLQYINENPGAIQKQIAKNLALEKSSVTKTLKFIEEREYVTKELPTTGNLKERSIFITDKGKELCKQIENIETHLNKELESIVPNNDLNKLKDILSSLLNTSSTN